MSEIKLISATPGSPIERVRGGDIVIAMVCQFSVSGDVFQVTGISVTKDSTQEAIRGAVKEAIEDAKDNLSLLGVVGTTGESTPVDNTTNVAILHAVVASEAEKVVESKRKTTPEVADKLAGPATDVLQNEIDKLLDSLGVATIPLLGQDGSKVWTLGEAISLRQALNDKVRMFLPDDRNDKAYK